MPRWRDITKSILWVIALLLVLSGCGLVSPAAPTAQTGPLPETQPLQPGAFQVPPGKALFVLRNFTRVSWQVAMGDYSLEVSPFPPGEGFITAQLAIEPGEYVWQARSPEVGEEYFITDEDTYTAHRFIIQAGQVYFVRVLSLAPGQHTLRYVVEPVLFIEP